MKHLLLNAKHEIDTLRRANEILAAKVEVVEAFTAALLGPRTRQGASIDVAWQLQKEIDRLDGKGDPAPL